MDELKTKIEEVINKIKNDEGIAKNFQSNPVKTVESLIGMDLPDEQINQVITAVKAKVNFDENGIIGAIGGLF